jgi:hypothetical protein
MATILSVYKEPTREEIIGRTDEMLKKRFKAGHITPEMMREIQETPDAETRKSMYCKLYRDMLDLSYST